MPTKPYILSRPSVVINTGSGSATDISQDLYPFFTKHGLPKPVIHVVEPGALADTFKTICGNGTDLLVVYGGDGTCNFGAAIAKKAGIPLIALPGGTMNMLPKALYGTDDWREALELALTQSDPRWQAGGRVNGKTFFCGLIMGDPIVMSEAREALRDGDVIEAVKQLPEIAGAIKHGEKFKFRADGKIFDRASNALQISCPGMTSGAQATDKFEIASAPQMSMTNLVGIGAKALMDDWRASSDVLVKQARTVAITGQGEFDILLDGEPDRVSCPIKITLDSEGVRVLAPDLNKKAK